ncbi:hypothetical protein SAMN05216207_105211 [Pseudonocardia ammonioxydans]|uniref:IrrE N-terminal-like domain-containing protein n=1 Tax=Pseudonocardia ammonioxydans TaxID=260086 RepID=A0A1I5GWT5_PSUAM|nr:hypothetical protein [Pseudonocardia ammonioxydans]SFO40419.1 hypothetical protein SAMN05216207_105211 [Pseudonocardia ammonioxydans]
MVATGARARSYATLVSVARDRLCELGLRPPLTVGALCTALGGERNTVIEVVATEELPIGAASGITGSQDHVEIVLYEARTTADHQQLIILHEFAHMLLQHPPSTVLHSASGFGFTEIDASAVALALGKPLNAESAPVTMRQPRRWWSRRPADASGSTASLSPSVYARVCEEEAEILATIMLNWLSSTPSEADGAGADPILERLTDALGHRWSPR